MQGRGRIQGREPSHLRDRRLKTGDGRVNSGARTQHNAVRHRQAGAGGGGILANSLLALPSVLILEFGEPQVVRVDLWFGLELSVYLARRGDEL